MARHIGRHIPGNPNVIAQNMLGAGGMTMTNWLYNLAPKDGSFLGVIQNGLPTQQAIGAAGVFFYVRVYRPIASPLMVMSSGKLLEERQLLTHDFTPPATDALTAERLASLVDAAKVDTLHDLGDVEDCGEHAGQASLEFFPRAMDHFEARSPSASAIGDAALPKRYIAHY